ncbi:MAG: uroporphyrinogen decarboxylase, partial [Thiobacillus sp. SCN 63-374]
LRDEWEIRDLSAPDPTDKLGYVMDAVRSIRRALDGSVPLIGFSGSPYTLACYMIEGGGSDDYRHIKTMLYSRPDLLHRILEVNTRAVIDYLNAQIEAGAQAVMIFDSWGGSLTPHAYKEFSLDYMERIVAALIKEREGRRIPSIIFTKGGGNWLEAMAGIGADAVGLDWTVDIGEARRRVGDKVALQGNLDPCALHGTPDSIRAEAHRIIDSYGNHPGHVFNLGHGISQFTNPDNVSVLVEAVHSRSRAVRAAPVSA